jgi:hypothetical protein
VRDYTRWHPQTAHGEAGSALSHALLNMLDLDETISGEDAPADALIAMAMPRSTRLSRAGSTAEHVATQGHRRPVRGVELVMQPVGKGVWNRWLTAARASRYWSMASRLAKTPRCDSLTALLRTY